MAKRASTGFDKKIFGVPVFPVANQSGNGVNNGNHSNGHDLSSLPPLHSSHQHHSDMHPDTTHESTTTSPHYTLYNPSPTPPPPFTIPPSPNTISPHTTSPTTNFTKRWRLRHVDFLPASLTQKSRKEDDFEKFGALVERANDWTREHAAAVVFCCESVTWSSLEKSVCSEAGVLLRSMSTERRTRFTRGLRLWYFAFEDAFTKGNLRALEGSHPDSPCFRLSHRTYAGDPKAENSFSSLLHKLNSDLGAGFVKGRLMRVETLEVLSDMGADTSVWWEQPDRAKDFTSVLRVLYAPDLPPTSAGPIDVHDFLPECHSRSPLNGGYETYAGLFQRAASFVHQQPILSFLGVQSVFVKVKKDTDTSDMRLWDKVTHCQHASAYGALSNQRTDFLQLLRLSYLTPTSAARNAPHSGNSGKKLFYKSFSAQPLRRALLPSGATTEEQEGVEGLYEDLGILEDRINAWLAFSGAKVAGVETLTTRLASGGQEVLSSEATCVHNQRERGLSKEPWRVSIRLILEGEFREESWQQSDLSCP